MPAGNFNTYAQYLKKQRQSDNEISSVNRIQREIFFFKNHARKESEILVPGLFLFFLFSWKSFIWGKNKLSEI